MKWRWGGVERLFPLPPLVLWIGWAYSVRYLFHGVWSEHVVPIAILSLGERTGVFSNVPVVTGGVLEIFFPLLY